MRTIIALLLVFSGLAAVDVAWADPYRWCAISGAGCGGNNCYFTTLEQCRAQIAGMGGSCQPNPFYDGRAVATPGEQVAAHRSRKRS